MARPHKPQEIKEAQGTARKDRAPETRHSIGATTCPRWLGPKAKQEWRRLAADLAEAGILRKDTRNALAAYCHAVATWRAAIKAQEAAGDDLQKLSKASVIGDKALKQMRVYGYQLGLGELFKGSAEAESERGLELLR